MDIVLCTLIVLREVCIPDLVLERLLTRTLVVFRLMHGMAEFIRFIFSGKGGPVLPFHTRHPVVALQRAVRVVERQHIALHRYPLPKMRSNSAVVQHDYTVSSHKKHA